MGGKHESQDDKRVERIQRNGQRPKEEPLPKEDPGGKHTKKDDGKNEK